MLVPGALVHLGLFRPILSLALLGTSFLPFLPLLDIVKPGIAKGLALPARIRKISLYLFLLDLPSSFCI